MALEGLLGQEKALQVLEDALLGSPADATELVLLSDRTEVTRFARSRIHQNVSQLNTRISVRVAVGQATTRVFTNSLESDSLRRAIAEAAALARMQAPNPRFGGLPAPQMGGEPHPNPPPSYFESTASMGPEARARTVHVVAQAASEAGLESYGTYRISTSELAVVTSTGIRAYAPHTTAYLKLLVEGEHGSGFSDALDRDAARIDADAVAREAVGKCHANRAQGDLAPGEYGAVFDPNAVADMLRFPAERGLGARQVLDGQSFMSGKIGERVTGEQVDLWDDPHDARCMPLPIDYEGLPAQRVDVIRGGVAFGPVYDAQTAHEAGTRSTGHASTPFSDYPQHPVADHIIMPVGAASAEEMVSRVEHGVWVTRFHYTHCPDGKRVIATGTTRDGTFLIQDGKVAGALRNLRLEMSVLDLLASIREAGKGKLCQDWWALNGMATNNYFVPSLRFGRVRFTGATTF